MKFVRAIVLQRARRTERRKAKETSKRTEDRKETTRKNVKRGRTRKAAENARDGRMRKWKRKEKARRETGNELMKEPVALMRVNLLPLLCTRDDIHTLTHTLCVKVASNSTCIHIRALVANAKLNPPVLLAPASY